MTSVSTPTTLAQLVARSRKLGADRSICNWGGGNTSAKATEIDFRGRQARILWVKGSGSDLASVTLPDSISTMCFPCSNVSA